MLGNQLFGAPCGATVGTSPVPTTGDSQVAAEYQRKISLSEAQVAHISRVSQTEINELKNELAVSKSQLDYIARNYNQDAVHHEISELRRKLAMSEDQCKHLVHRSEEERRGNLIRDNELLEKQASLEEEVRDVMAAAASSRLRADHHEGLLQYYRQQELHSERNLEEMMVRESGIVSQAHRQLDQTILECRQLSGDNSEQSAAIIAQSKSLHAQVISSQSVIRGLEHEEGELRKELVSSTNATEESNAELAEKSNAVLALEEAVSVRIQRAEIASEQRGKKATLLSPTGDEATKPFSSHCSPRLTLLLRGRERCVRNRSEKLILFVLNFHLQTRNLVPLVAQLHLLVRLCNALLLRFEVLLRGRNLSLPVRRSPCPIFREEQRLLLLLTIWLMEKLGQWSRMELQVCRLSQGKHCRCMFLPMRALRHLLSGKRRWHRVRD